VEDTNSKASAAHLHLKSKKNEAIIFNKNSPNVLTIEENSSAVSAV